VETPTREWEPILERLSRLERANRRWRVVATASFLVTIILVLMGATAQRVPDEIRARAFVVVASDGRNQGRLGASAQGAPELVLYDPKGIGRASLSLAQDGDPKLYLRDEDDTASASMRVSQYLAMPEIELSTRHGSTRNTATMSVYEGVFPEVSFWAGGLEGISPSLARMRANGAGGADILLKGGESSGVVLQGDKAYARMTAGFLGAEFIAYGRPGEGATLSSPGSLLAGGSSLDLHHNGKSRALVALDEKGSPHVILSDETGETRAALGHVDLKEIPAGTVSKRPASSLVLFGEDGKVLWRTP